jgi:hypothetical protein
LLKIKTVRHYRHPKYPRGIYFEHAGLRPGKIAGGIALAPILSLLLSSCAPGLHVETDITTGTTTTMRHVITESEAKSRIDALFADHGIFLQDNGQITIKLSDGTTQDIALDGFSDNLSIGYEYISNEDAAALTPEAITALEAAGDNQTGTHIKIITAEHDYYDGYLEKTIQDFIEELRSQGVI